MRNAVIIFGAVMMVQGQNSMPMSGLVELAPSLIDCAESTTGDHHTPSALSSQAFNKAEREYNYSEVALHYTDGTKSVVSTSGCHSRCFHQPSPLMGSKASRDLPYKASWTRLRYTIPPGQGSCIRDEDVITEKVEVMNIRVLPSDTSLPATLTPDGDEIANSNTELVHLEHLPEHLPEHSETVGPLSEEEDGAPVRRRATFGELCQLLALFTALGLLHYVSMRWAARWWSPQVERPRRTAQCEE